MYLPNFQCKHLTSDVTCSAARGYIAPRNSTVSLRFAHRFCGSLGILAVIRHSHLCSHVVQNHRTKVQGPNGCRSCPCIHRSPWYVGHTAKGVRYIDMVFRCYILWVGTQLCLLRIKSLDSDC